jgi:hypothetical protein
MSKFDFILKSGAIITVECEHCTLKHINNALMQCIIDGLSNESDYPMYIRMNEVAAVVQREEDRNERAY